MSSSRVTPHSTLTAVSSKPVRSGKTHTLSALDHAMGFHTLHIIFYYKNEGNNLFESFDLDPLRESLSEVLTMYPTMTGRLARGVDGNWEVRCNDAGVRVIMANVDTTLKEWLSSASGCEEEHLIAWDEMPHDPNTWSPFRIQINSFKEGGVAIGLSCSHMLADLTCAASFFKSWTETHCHLPITHPPSFTPICASPLPNSDTVSLPLYATKAQIMATGTFKFSSSIMKQCLSKVHDTCPNATPFDFLSALFWTRIARLKPPKNQNQTHSLSICTDFRRLMKPPLPIGYFGNALHFSMISVKVEDIESDQLGGIASKVHDHLVGLVEEEIRSAMEWLESEKEREGGKFRYGSELTCVCMEHMVISSEQSLLYSAMFSSNEKPEHVSCHVGNVDSEGLIMVMPSSEEGLARTVMVTLPQEELAKVSKDQAILQLEPTMILAGCGVEENH
ncbi:Transferase [Sesbania bispinosa]|nr:Transferase [Sesbania bispinosa]